ncbi:MAG: efflux RND transporter periplasmic adaptor subunit [Planctomycetes bacterium]|nr:efflux RND transporter periplasmic adaptor subunit [Planctomycetota bacterium]
MSIEQPLDPHLIEQTKQQIRSLVAEIAQLSKTDVAPEEFYGQFLPRVVSALAAVGGAVWTVNPEGRLALQYQINIQDTKLRENEEQQAQHSRLLYKVLSDGVEVLVPSRSGPGDVEQVAGETPAANPTDFLLVFGVLKTDLETVGLVEVFQRSEVGPSTQKGYLRFLGQMCELAGDFLKSHQLRHFSDRQTLWSQLEDFTRAVHASLDPRETAYTIANEGRRLIECDRLSVAIRKGSKCKIEAVSGQDLFDKRSNIVRLLGKLATAVVATGDTVWYTGETRDLAPQVEDAVQEYVDEAHSKTVAVLPLQRPAPPEEDDPKKRTKPEPPIGALVVERIEDSRLSANMVHRAEVVRQHSSTALANAIEHQNLVLMPVWRALGKTRWVLQARTLPKTLSISGGVLLVLLVFALWPARFTMESKGTLEPVWRQDVFAGIDGVVEELKVAHGEMVAKDQLLALLRNTDLEVALTDVQGQRMATTERLFAVQRSMVGERRLSTEERSRLAGEQAELKQKLLSLDAQWALYKAKQLELDAKSPMDGQVITWDLRNRLIHRPVQRGQILMRVANPDGPWQLELKMPENHMGPVVERQQFLFGLARKKLRELLLQDAREKSPEAPEEEVDRTVEAELATVPDEELPQRISEAYRRRFCEALRPIVEEVSDEGLRARLGEVLHAETYGEARLKLDDLLRQAGDGQEAIDADLMARLKDLPNEKAPDTGMKVAYILATEPGTTREGEITEIHRSAEIRGDEGNTVLIKVAIDKAELPQLRPGATVTAKVYCGRRALGYVLLHDLIAFIRSRILFRYF